MSPAAAAAQRRRIRWFVAAHCAAVGGIYALALAVGGGLAPPPFPPDLRPSGQPDARTAALAGPGLHPGAELAPIGTWHPAAHASATTSAVAGAGYNRSATDIPAPWAREAEGGVRAASD